MAENEKPDGGAKENIRQTYIGGQAVMEGVMMRGQTVYSLAVRNQDKEIEVVLKEIGKKTKKLFFLKWPIIRGVAAFVNSLALGMKVIYDSADMAGLDDLTEENPSKFDLWLEKKFGDKLYDYIMGFSVVLAILFSIGLFMVLPTWLSSFVTPLLKGNTWAIGIVEGIVRICIFIVYILLISKTKEIKRIFGYHGAEHKTINCYEHNEELTVDNVKKHTRLHKRCGTSFLLIVMIVSMIVFFFVPTDTVWLRILSRILLVPVIAGLSYEIIKWAGSSDSILVKIISFPGLCLQKITTREPDDGQIEVAISAMNKVLEVENGFKIYC